MNACSIHAITSFKVTRILVGTPSGSGDGDFAKYHTGTPGFRNIVLKEKVLLFFTDACLDCQSSRAGDLRDQSLLQAWSTPSGVPLLLAQPSTCETKTEAEIESQARTWPMPYERLSAWSKVLIRAMAALWRDKDQMSASGRIVAGKQKR